MARAGGLLEHYTCQLTGCSSVPVCSTARRPVGNVEMYPPLLSAHVDDGDSADPSRTVDTHLVAGAVPGDRGSQGRVQRDPLTGDVCLSWHNDGVLGVPEIIRGDRTRTCDPWSPRPVLISR